MALGQSTLCFEFMVSRLLFIMRSQHCVIFILFLVVILVVCLVLFSILNSFRVYVFFFFLLCQVSCEVHLYVCPPCVIITSYFTSAFSFPFVFYASFCILVLSLNKCFTISSPPSASMFSAFGSSQTSQFMTN